MKITTDQLADIGERMLVQKTDQSFLKSLPGFSEWSMPERLEFLHQCVEIAHSIKLYSESGIASYALGAWWLDLGFELQSQHLLRVLNSELPEVRKVHAMNEWIHVRLKSPDTPEVADQALQAALSETTAWGTK